METLFSDGSKRPLPYRLKPEKLDDFIGQKKIIGENSILGKLLRRGKLVSSIFHGSPGTGKTSLAMVISKMLDYYFISLNATNCGVQEIKNAKRRLFIGANQEQFNYFRSSKRRINARCKVQTFE